MWDGGCRDIDAAAIHCNTKVIQISTSIIWKALQAYLEDYSDYLIAQERLDDEEDKVVSCGELKDLAGLQD